MDVYEVRNFRIGNEQFNDVLFATGKTVKNKGELARLMKSDPPSWPGRYVAIEHSGIIQLAKKTHYEIKGI